MSKYEKIAFINVFAIKVTMGKKVLLLKSYFNKSIYVTLKWN